MAGAPGAEGPGGGRTARRDPISGIWGAVQADLLHLTFDGHAAVTGTVMNGRPGNFAAIERGIFDLQSGVLTLEGHAARPDNREAGPYVIEGRLDRGVLTVSYSFFDIRGNLTLRRVTRWTRALRRLRALAGWAQQYVELVVIPVRRLRLARRRPSKAANLRCLRDRGETLASLTFRDATPADIPALAALHVKTWSATYPFVRRPPTCEIRERQWREAFATTDGRWFCILIENAKGELVGFAKGIRDDGGSGDLNKIYLLTEYQRLGLGRQLVVRVARRFLSQGVSSMTLSADAANPSCRFYEALGAEHQRDAAGKVCRGAYIWRDLKTLTAAGPEA